MVGMIEALSSCRFCGQSRTPVSTNKPSVHNKLGARG